MSTQNHEKTGAEFPMPDYFESIVVDGMKEILSLIKTDNPHPPFNDLTDETFNRLRDWAVANLPMRQLFRLFEAHDLFRKIAWVKFRLENKEQGEPTHLQLRAKERKIVEILDD